MCLNRSKRMESVPVEKKVFISYIVIYKVIELK